MSLRLISTITEPDANIVTLAEAKRQCYIPTSDEDSTMEAMLTLLIKAASRSCENFTWRQLPQAQFEYRMDAFPEVIELPKNPVISVDKIEYVNNAGTTVTYEASNYRVDLYSDVARIEPVTVWPGSKEQQDAVIVTFTAGYDGTNTLFPEDLKLGVLSLISYLYDNRENVAVVEGRSLAVEEIPWSTRHIFGQYTLRR